MTSIPHQRFGHNFRVLIALVGILAALAVVTQRAGAAYRPRPEDDRPPADARYQAALQQGLAGDYAGAESAFTGLARARRGTSTGAWSLYQALLAAKALRDENDARALQRELIEGYPGHPVALRLAETPRVAVPTRPRPDCGPRALQILCEAAGMAASVEELSRQCGSDEHGTTLEGLVRAARAQGLRVAPAQVDHWFLRRHRPSGLAWVDGDHYVAFFPGRTPDQFQLADPNVTGRQQVDVAKLRERSQGIVLLAAWGKQLLPPGLTPAPREPDRPRKGKPHSGSIPGVNEHESTTVKQ